MHMPVGYTEMYARRLDELSPLNVREAVRGRCPAKGHCSCRTGGPSPDVPSIAGRDCCHASGCPPFDTLHRPSVDVMFQSAAETFRDRVLGVVMTGMGSDGKQGSAWIKSQGGLVFTESEETCVVYGMPGSVVEAGLSDKGLPLESSPQANSRGGLKCLEKF